MADHKRKPMKNKIYSVLLFALVLGSVQNRLDCAAAEEPNEATHYDRLYAFEHRVLPRWTHQSSGVFFADLEKGSVDRMKEAATEMVSSEFAAALKVRNVLQPTGVIITFQHPPKPVACFFAFVTKSGEDHRYLTLEMTEDILGLGFKSVIGEWTPDGSHKNLGSFKFDSEEDFLRELQRILKKG